MCPIYSFTAVANMFGLRGFAPLYIIWVENPNKKAVPIDVTLSTQCSKATKKML